VVVLRIPIAFHGLPLTQAAVAFARRVHAGQRRKADGAPFIVHPLEVASLLYRADAPDHLIAAGALHDTIEKTDALAADLRKRFGSRVATLVVAVTEDEQIKGYARRKAALREQVASAGEEALLLFAADKLSKVRELGLGASPARKPHSCVAGVTGSRARRLTHYLRCLALLEEQLPNSVIVGQLRMELGAHVDGAFSAPVRASTL